jgi:hypothetical protein
MSNFDALKISKNINEHNYFDIFGIGIETHIEIEDQKKLYSLNMNNFIRNLLSIPLIKIFIKFLFYGKGHSLKLKNLIYGFIELENKNGKTYKEIIQQCLKTNEEFTEEMINMFMMNKARILSFCELFEKYRWNYDFIKLIEKYI